jgi:hypothetical protein
VVNTWGKAGLSFLQSKSSAFTFDAYVRSCDLPYTRFSAVEAGCHTEERHEHGI